MRTTRIILMMFFLLLFGGNSIYAKTHILLVNSDSTKNLMEKRHVKLTNKNQNCLFVDDTDIDLEEEHLESEIVKHSSGSNFFSNKFISTQNYNSLSTKHFILNLYYKRFKTSPPYYGNSNPIYILQSDLRL